MKALKKKGSLVLCVLFVLGVLANTSAMTATPEEIQASIEAGIDWLVAQQDLNNGYWDEWGQRVSPTAFAVIKLEERAFELPDINSPFDPCYPHKDAVEAGLAYIFKNAHVVPISVQFAGDPDTDGDHKGVYFGSRRVYDTGISMMAIAASRAPNKVVAAPGSPVDGWTYKQVLDDAVDWMAFAQNDSGSGRGGWNYDDTDNGESRTDNSNGGYAVLGLAYAEAPLFGFNCTIPEFVKDELSLYVDWIQCDDGDDDGGSGYSSPCGWVNILKTGNLIFQMTFVGDPCESPRLQRALAYLGRWWNHSSDDPGWKGPPPHYQAMYCVMKGLTYANIETIDVGGTPVNWYDEFAQTIVSNQQGDGSWPWDYWGGQILATEWALLTLEAIAPPQPEPFGQWVYQCSEFEPMNLDDYVTGTPPFTWTYDEATVENVTLEIGAGNVLTIDYDHSWYGEDVVLFTVTDGIGLSSDVWATFTVIGVPVVGDIPDQTTPFEPFDLDDYLSAMAPEDVEWSASDPGGGWTVEIDAGNVVTVTAPEGCTESATITFTATNAVCPEWWLALNNEPPSDSDDATFVCNRPPDCSEAFADPGCLWPPNHKMVSVNILGVTDPDGDPISITITGITSDEATATEKAAGGKKHAPDAAGVGTDTAQVRSERSAQGNGRVYVINFTATDGKGGECEGTVEVRVPHDQRPSRRAPVPCEAVDDGQNYDATDIN